MSGTPAGMPQTTNGTLAVESCSSIPYSSWAETRNAPSTLFEWIISMALARSVAVPAMSRHSDIPAGPEYRCDALDDDGKVGIGEEAACRFAEHQGDHVVCCRRRFRACPFTR